MERFTNNQNVNPYSRLAYYYDYLLQDEESLRYWLKYIESKPFSSCLELASGSGIMASILKKKGYDIIASDISFDMKKASKVNFDGEYKIINMIDYDLNRKFDLILCICDSINYLEEEELYSFFECAKKHLNNDGRIIFDMHHLERLSEFKEEYIEEGELPDGNFYQWTIDSDVMDKKIMEHFTFYLNNDMIQEHHIQSVFNPNLVKSIMEMNGFKVNIIDNFIPHEKILIIGEK